MQKVTGNLDKLLMTEAVEDCIRRNLALKTDDVLLWCKEKVLQADVIFGVGEILYVYGDGIGITIDTESLRIITAEPIKARVRIMEQSDYVCLPEFLYQAVFIPEGAEPPSRSVIDIPEIDAYIRDFGTRTGDFGVAAEVNGQVIGAAWTRIISSYGHLDDQTPELAISVFPEFRGYGIGEEMMEELFMTLRAHDYSRISLSVQKENPAVRFYHRLGFEIIEERTDAVGNTDFIMVKKLKE